jgi:hypothetical protein
MREIHAIKTTCFSQVKGHMSILYVSCIKFPTNRFVGNFCPIFIQNGAE